MVYPFMYLSLIMPKHTSAKLRHISIFFYRDHIYEVPNLFVTLLGTKYSAMRLLSNSVQA